MHQERECQAAAQRHDRERGHGERGAPQGPGPQGVDQPGRVGFPAGEQAHREREEERGETEHHQSIEHQCRPVELEHADVAPPHGAPDIPVEGPAHLAAHLVEAGRIHRLAVLFVAVAADGVERVADRAVVVGGEPDSAAPTSDGDGDPVVADHEGPRRRIGARRHDAALDRAVRGVGPRLDAVASRGRTTTATAGCCRRSAGRSAARRAARRTCALSGCGRPAAGTDDEQE